MERLLLWFLEGFAEEQGGPQARRRSRRSGPEVRQPAGTAGGLRPVTGGLLGFAEKGAEPLPVRAEAFGQVARGGFPEPGPGSLTRRKTGKKDDAVPSVSEA